MYFLPLCPLINFLILPYTSLFSNNVLQPQAHLIKFGILCGLSLYPLAILAGIFIYFIIKLKHIRIKFEERKHGKSKRVKTNN